MKALVLEGVQQLAVREWPDPVLSFGGAIVRVKANGVCRSDWHAWVGDLPRKYPVVSGHEMAGVVEEVSPAVTRFKKGDRVVVPFSGSDGTCSYCHSGKPHLCDNALIPGRETYPGGYGEYVNVPLADRNLVHLPEQVSFTEGAALGCRFMTSYHGLVDRAEVRPGEWVVIFGCGGIGLSAVHIAASIGARVIGVDVNPANLELARKLGADFVLNSRECEIVESIREITHGGAHVSVDALGSTDTCVNGLASLRKAGRHLQIGLTTKQEGGRISVPIDQMVFKELSLIGTIGMPPFRFDAMLPLVASGRLTPGKMVTGEISLSEVGGIFEQMTRSSVTGTYVVTKFH